LYKEDFNKFIKALGEAVDHVKTELMPDFDFDAYNHDYPEAQEDSVTTVITGEIAEIIPETIVLNNAPVKDGTEEVDKW
jgi:hypothetical protein